MCTRKWVKSNESVMHTSHLDQYSQNLVSKPSQEYFLNALLSQENDLSELKAINNYPTQFNKLRGQEHPKKTFFLKKDPVR